MAEAVKKEKTVKPDKEAAKATLQALSKPKEKAVAVKAPSAVQAAPKAEEKSVEAVKTAAPLVKPEATKVEAAKEAPKPAPEATKAEAKVEVKKEEAAPEGEVAKPKAEAKKEADPNKEFVDGIMTEMSLKGASKKRLIRNLGEQYGFDKQKVMFRLKRALITERYAAAHEAAGAH